MTVYDPTPTVTIDGVDFTGETVNRVQITLGRTTVDEQPRAGYSTISLLITDGTYPNIELNHRVQVSILQSNGSDPAIFTGYVSDVVRSVQQYGSKGSTVRIDVTVVGPISRLAKFSTAANYPKQYDGDRVAAILQDVFTTTWNEVLPTLTWAGLDPALTWLTYDPGYAGNVVTPGTFELTEYSGGEVNAQGLLNYCAQSALGVLWEDGLGELNYDDAGTRVDRVTNNGYTELPAGYIGAIGTASQTRTADLINQITITYKNSQTVTDEDAQSIFDYGLFAGQRETNLEKQADAEIQADLFISTRATPRVNLSSVNVPLDNPDLPDALRDALIGVYCGMPISIPDMPGSIYSTPFAGFVEGWTWTVTQKQANLNLTLSDYGLTALQVAWDQVTATLQWQNVTPTLTWENARTVA